MRASSSPSPIGSSTGVTRSSPWISRQPAQRLGLLRLVVGIGHGTMPEHVVEGDEAAWPQEAERRP
ncbi:MAG: hypothetical protein R3D25_21540 [Geminicoccaceae bacterium]